MAVIAFLNVYDIAALNSDWCTAYVLKPTLMKDCIGLMNDNAKANLSRCAIYFAVLGFLTLCALLLM